uniref:Putative lipocalin-2 1 n=1 Tax=Amblyomma triste TaxID=251400 RepID=A0A023GAY7_AMBTT
MNLSLAFAGLVATLCSHTWGASDIEDDGEDIDIREALNTTATLWLLRQTYKNGFSLCIDNNCINEKEICIRNQKISLSDKEYHFVQKLILDKEDITTYYKGTFNDAKKPPKSMDVSQVTSEGKTDNTGAGLRQLWTLGFWTPTSRCLVFFIAQLDNEIRDDIGTCELYTVGKPGLSDPPSDCKAFFERNCNTTTVYTPYTDDCRDISGPVDITSNTNSQS